MSEKNTSIQKLNTFENTPEREVFATNSPQEIVDDLNMIEESIVLEQSAEETRKIKNDVEREPGQSYTFLSLLEKNKTVYDKMKPMIEASGYTIEARSASIEHVW